MSSEFDKKLQTQIVQLRKDTTPERDLWPGIEVAITAKKHHHIPWTAIAASIAACLLVAVAVSFTHMRTDANERALRVITELDSLHQQEMSTLKIAFSKSQSLTNNWDKQLRDMDQAAEAIKMALKQDPQNLILLKMLNDVYQKQIDLLKTVHEPGVTNHLQNSDLT